MGSHSDFTLSNSKAQRHWMNTESWDRIPGDYGHTVNSELSIALLGIVKLTAHSVATDLCLNLQL